jgi:hypothetical protein
VSIIIDYPWYFLVFCLLLGAAYALVLYWLRMRRKAERDFPRGLSVVLSLLRAVAVTVIAFLLFSPLVKHESNRREKPIVVLAQDNSKSLDYCRDSAYYHGDYLAQMDRLADELSNDYDVQRLVFGTEVQQVGEGGGNQLVFSDQSTDISNLLTDIGERYYNRNVGAVVVASDGIYNVGANPVNAASVLTFPVYTVAMGDTTVYPDAAVANARFNRIAYLGNSFPLEITVSADRLQGRSSMLNVSLDGRKLFSKPLQFTDSRFSTTESITIDADRAGLHNYIVEIVPLDGEKSVRNNRRVIPIEVIDGHQKIAIVAAAPHPDVAALRAAIGNNANYEVETFLAADFNKNPRDYNLLIFHQLPSRTAGVGLDLARLLQSGTPALFVVGSQTDLARLNSLHTGLEIYARIDRQNEVSPLQNKNFTFFTLDDDVAQRIAQFPPLLSPFGEYKLGGNAQTLFTARIGSVNSGQPLVAVTQQQEHRYAFIAGEGLWRWRLADWQANQSHGNFDAFINKLVVFTALRANNERFSVQAKNIFAQSEAVVVEAQLYNDSYEPVNQPDVELNVRNQNSPEGSKYILNRTATGYGINLGILPPGSYSYTASTHFNGRSYSASGAFLVEDLQLEAMNTVADHSLLATLSATTDGAMVDAHNVGNIAEMLRQRDDLKTIVYSETSYSDMLNLPLILIFILLLLTAEWVLRKYNGTL